MSPQVEKWLVDHVKGLHIRTQYGEAIYTAMLVRLNGDPYLLTAGHCLEDIDHARKGGVNIDEAHFLPTNGSVAFSILDIATVPLYYLNVTDSIDIGLMPLRSWYTNQLGQELFLDEHFFTDLPLDYTGCILVGFPTQFEQFMGNVINVNPAFISVTPTPKPSNIPDADPPRFFGKIPEVPFDISGTSGGPIIGFLYDEKSDEYRYWIVALQSGWIKKDLLIFATNISTCLPILLQKIADDQAQQST